MPKIKSNIKFTKRNNVKTRKGLTNRVKHKSHVLYSISVFHIAAESGWNLLKCTTTEFEFAEMHSFSKKSSIYAYKSDKLAIHLRIGVDVSYINWNFDVVSALNRLFCSCNECNIFASLKHFEIFFNWFWRCIAKLFSQTHWDLKRQNSISYGHCIVENIYFRTYF